MNTINQWSALICLSSAACVIIEFILPAGNMEKILKMVLNVFILVSLSFFAESNIPRINIKFDKYKHTTSQINHFTEALNSQIESLAENNIKAIIEGILKNMGIKSEKIEIFMDTDKENCISISKCRVYIPKGLKKSGYSTRLTSSDLLQIKSELEKTFNIETEVIIKD